MSPDHNPGGLGSSPCDVDAPIRLPPSLNIAMAEDLLRQLRDRVREAAPDAVLALDGSAVERVAVPCLQVLAAAARALPGLRIVAPSAALVAAVGELGLSAAIPLES